MEAKNIKSVDDAERFIEGCLNDFESGIATKSDAMKHLADYTARIIEMAKPVTEIRSGCYQPTVDNTTYPPPGYDKPQLDLKLRSDAIELLDAYSKFLEKNSYLDVDWNMEEPYAIDQFLKENLNLCRKKYISIEDVKKKLLELNPQIKSDEFTNPFAYRDIRDWYNELSKL